MERSRRAGIWVGCGIRVGGPGCLARLFVLYNKQKQNHKKTTRRRREAQTRVEKNERYGSQVDVP